MIQELRQRTAKAREAIDLQQEETRRQQALIDAHDKEKAQADLIKEIDDIVAAALLAMPQCADRGESTLAVCKSETYRGYSVKDKLIRDRFEKMGLNTYAQARQSPPTSEYFDYIIVSWAEPVQPKY